MFSSYEGQPVGRILRIWPDGSLDSTFHTDISQGYAERLIQLPNGRILAGGFFLYPGDTDTLHLIRLLPDGTLDSTFNNHTDYKLLPQLSFGDFGLSVRALLPLPDGTMMVGGGFTHINGQLRRGIALLDTVGNLLNTAFTGQGCGLWYNYNDTDMYSGLTDIRMAPDGSIFVCGFFKGFDDGTVSDTSMTFIAKLHGLSTGIEEHKGSAWQVKLWPNPGMDVLHIETGVKGRAEVRVLDGTGRAVLAESAISGHLELKTAGLAPAVFIGSTEKVTYPLITVPW